MKPDESDRANVRFVCPEHASRPSPIYQQIPLQDFVGKFCKLGFKTPCEKIEHMWLKVLRVEGDELIGQLDNTPLYADCAIGDLFAFNRKEIENVMG